MAKPNADGDNDVLFFSEESLLVDDVSDNIDRALIAVTTVHELAHQWFGNLVTSSWWDDIWVNEGLTTLYENIMLKQVRQSLGQKQIA